MYNINFVRICGTCYTLSFPSGVLIKHILFERSRSHFAETIAAFEKLRIKLLLTDWSVSRCWYRFKMRQNIVREFLLTWHLVDSLKLSWKGFMCINSTTFRRTYRYRVPISIYKFCCFLCQLYNKNNVRIWGEFRPSSPSSW